MPVSPSQDCIERLAVSGIGCTGLGCQWVHHFNCESFATLYCQKITSHRNTHMYITGRVWQS